MSTGLLDLLSDDMLASHRGGPSFIAVQDTYGSPGVLELRGIDKPVIGEGRGARPVHAVGVGQGVWHLIAGLPYLVRNRGVGLRAPKDVRGYDLAGDVEAVRERDPDPVW